MPGVSYYLIAQVGKTGGVEDFITPQTAYNRSPEKFEQLINEIEGVRVKKIMMIADCPQCKKRTNFDTISKNAIKCRKCGNCKYFINGKWYPTPTLPQHEAQQTADPAPLQGKLF